MIEDNKSAKRRGFQFRKPIGGGIIIDIPGPPPRQATIPQKTVLRGIAEGWITIEGARKRVSCGGNQRDPEMKQHEFLNCDRIIIHEIDRDSVYEVVHQPGNYLEQRWDGGNASKIHLQQQLLRRVDWFFNIDLIDVRDKAVVGPEVVRAERRVF